MAVESRNKPNDTSAGMARWESLFNVHYRELCYFAERLVGDDAAAEDIVQELFVSLYEKNIAPEHMDSVRPYLYRATRNRCVDYQRQHQLKKNKYSELPTNISEDYILAAIAETEAVALISEAIDSLPTECGKVMTLFMKGFNGAEIAEQLSLSPSTVRAQKRRGISLLRDKLPPLVFILFFETFM